MIKCDGFLKLLKLSCFGLLISFFTLFVGSSASATYQVIGLDKYPSAFNSQYNLGFLKGGGILTDFLGTTKGILALDTNTIFWWTPDGRPYWYSPDTQGFFTTVFSCPEITATGTTYNLDFSSCSGIPISGLDYLTMFKGFFSHVLPGDIVWYDYYHSVSGVSCTNRYSKHIVCFSSHELSATLCFAAGTCMHGCQGDGCPNFCRGTICNGGFYDSQNYSSLNFGNVPFGSIGVAPGQNGYGGQYEGSDGNSSQGTVDTTLTGATVFGECTVGYAKSVAENQGMSKFLCYGGLPIDSNGLALPVAGTGASVFEIFQASNDGKNFSDWFTYWNGVYTNRYVYDSSIWSGTPAPLYSYFNFVSQYGPQFEVKEIQDYCRIIVNNMSESQKWTGIQSWCPFQAGGGRTGLDGGGAWDDDTGSGSSSSSAGRVPIGVNWGGVGAISGNENKDALTFIQDFFNKAREIIPTNFSDIGGGFLPTYIITFLCAVILFRFLKH